jgi:hypothetical protein
VIDQPERDPAVTRLLERRGSRLIDDPGPLHDPVRLLTTVGSVVAIASSFLPWAELEEFPRSPLRSGWSGRLDGFLLALMAAVLIVLVATRAFAGTRARTIRLLPLFLGPTALILWVAGYQYLEAEMEIWRHTGLGAAFLAPAYVCLVGTAMMAIGAVWLGLREGFAPLRTGDPSEAVPVTRIDVARSVVWLVAGAAGGVLGLGGVLVVTGTETLPLPLVLATLLGALVGGGIGTRLGRLLFRD